MIRCRAHRVSAVLSALAFALLVPACGEGDMLVADQDTGSIPLDGQSEAAAQDTVDTTIVDSTVQVEVGADAFDSNATEASTDTTLGEVADSGDTAGAPDVDADTADRVPVSSDADATSLDADGAD